MVEFLLRLKSTQKLLDWKFSGREKKLRGFPKDSFDAEGLDPVRAVCLVVTGETVSEGQEVVAAARLALSAIEFEDVIAAANNDLGKVGSARDYRRYRQWLRQQMIRSVGLDDHWSTADYVKSCLMQEILQNDVENPQAALK
jgi:hypothetical protein